MARSPPDSHSNKRPKCKTVADAGVQDRLLASNPMTRLSLPRSEKQRITPVSVIEVQDLADAMPQRCRAMVITQAGLGLRVAELLALRVRDVDDPQVVTLRPPRVPNQPSPLRCVSSRPGCWPTIRAPSSRAQHPEEKSVRLSNARRVVVGATTIGLAATGGAIAGYTQGGWTPGIGGLVGAVLGFVGSSMWARANKVERTSGRPLLHGIRCS